MKILIVRTDNIGDMICTFPLFEGLKTIYPSAQLDIFTNNYVSPVLHANHYVSNVYTYTKGKHSKNIVIFERLRKLWIYLKIFFKKYDWIIVTGKLTPFLGFLAIRSKVIIRREHLPISSASFGFIPVDTNQSDHEVVRTWKLGGPLGLGVDVVPPRSLFPFASIDASHRPVKKVGLQLSARRPQQKWSIQKYAELIRLLRENSELEVNVVWSPGSRLSAEHPGDDEKAAELQSLVGDVCVRFLPTSTLDELIQKIQRFDLLVTPDGGAAHIAGAAGLKLVVMFGDSDPQRWAPWQAEQVILVGKDRSVESVTAQDVKNAIDQLNSLQN